MALGPGARLGSYEVLSTLGAGGMGEVYRARDTKLGREVAIKVVLEAFLADRDRLARFEREARALAALNHPNIATLHGMEEADGRHFLVMELVDGLTLGEHLTRGPLAVEAAIAAGVQIAEALEAAHEKGIVHRDLKPANIKITPDDKVKVLDFGLAKAGAESSSSPVSASLANSPTLTAMGTQAGMILGTASYMSPEQARGMSGDHRSDVFSFGVVLYEMLTGRQPFQGETVSDVLASVLAREPDLAALSPDLAPRLSELVKRCLEKHPRRRWQAMGDVRLELEVISAQPRRVNEPAATGPLDQRAQIPTPVWRRALPIAGAVALGAAIATAAFMASRPVPAAPAISRFVLPFPEGLQRTATSRPSLAISPDGARVAFTGSREIYVRTLSDLEPRLLNRNTSANLAATPFSVVFSPDGKSLAYWDQADEKIKRIELAGGGVVTVCATTTPNGLTWSADHIYFAGAGGIRRVAAAGGESEIVIPVGQGIFVTAPQVMDDGRLLFSLAPPVEGASDRWTRARIVLQRPGDAAATTLVEGGSHPHYVPSGHLVYQSAGVIYARAFDPARGTVGGATSIIEGVLRGVSALGAGLAWYTVSANGTLVYMPGPVGSAETEVKITWFDRAGKAEALPIPAGPYMHPRVSPDGKRIAFSRVDASESSVWVYDLVAGGSARRLTFGGTDRYPTWSSDSEWVIFQSNRGGDEGLYRQRAGISGTAERLTTAGKNEAHIPHSASPDGAVLLFDQAVGGGPGGAGSTSTLMAYSFKDRKSSPYGGITSLNMTGATFSPDGKWVAYSTREPGQTTNLTHVQPYPATGAKYQISTTREDGHHETWSRNGRELFYTPGPGAFIAAMKVTTTPSFSYGPGDPAARPFTNAPPSAWRPYDVGGPGVRFLGLTVPGSGESAAAIPNEMRVVLNWFEDLKARVK